MCIGDASVLHRIPFSHCIPWYIGDPSILSSRSAEITESVEENNTIVLGEKGVASDRITTLCSLIFILSCAQVFSPNFNFFLAEEVKQGTEAFAVRGS